MAAGGMQVLIALVVLVVFISVILVAFKSGWFSGDSRDSREDKEELSTRDRRDEFRVPLRRRMHAWPLPLRIAAGVAVLLAIAFTFMSYQLTRTGSTGALLTTETYMVSFAVVGVIGGIWLQRWSDGRVEWLTIMFEDEDGGGTIVEEPYMPSETSVSNGSRIVQVCRDNRVLGLFWRFKQVADERKLRGKGKLPGDRLEVEIPSHAIEHDDGLVIETSPEGDRVIEGPANPDVTYGSPNNLSYERSQQMRRENTQIKIKNKRIEAENTELSRSLDRLYTKIENAEHMERDDFKADVMELLGPLMGMQQPGPGAQPPVEGGEQGGGQPVEGGQTGGQQR